MWPDGSFSRPRPCVILLHGFPGSARNDDLSHALCRTGCVVLTPHHRGAWGSEGKYLVSNCVEDAVNIARHVRSPGFLRKFNVDPDLVFLGGHSMGGCSALNASKVLPWLRGLLLIAPFDPYQLIKEGSEEKLKALLGEGEVLHHDGKDVLYADLAKHAEEYSFPNAFGSVKDQNLFVALGSLDLVAPPEQMTGELEAMLKAYGSSACQRFVRYPAGHGLLGARCAFIRDAASFIHDCL